MLQLLNRFVDICLLRRGPQDLPASTVFAALCLGLYTVLVAIAEAWFGEPQRALPWSLLTLGVTLVVIPGMLRFRGFSGRTPQTLAALAGCGVLFMLVQLPLVTALTGSADGGGLLPILFLGWLILFFWGFAVEGHILRLALSIPFAGGVLISVLMFALSQALYWTLFQRS